MKVENKIPAANKKTLWKPRIQCDVHIKKGKTADKDSGGVIQHAMRGHHKEFGRRYQRSTSREPQLLVQRSQKIQKAKKNREEERRHLTVLLFAVTCHFFQGI